MPDTRGYTLYNSVYVTFWERADYRDRKGVSGSQGTGVRQGTDGHHGAGGHSMGSGIILYLDHVILM